MGVYGHIATQSNVTGITVTTITNAMKTGASAVKNALLELEAHGYLTREQTRKPNGELGPRVYRLTDGGDAR